MQILPPIITDVCADGRCNTVSREARRAHVPVEKGGIAMPKDVILRSFGADGCAHAFDSERVRNKGGARINKKIECMKDAGICYTCTKENCKGTPSCVEKHKRELEKMRDYDGA